jgi:dephospho-CoA kinase
MLKIGITGGIGSGKSTVARVFETLGIPVFNADKAAKTLMDNDPDLKTALQNIFGTNIYNNGRLNRPLLSSIVFKDKDKLQQLNQIVHPKVIAWGETWHSLQQTPYTLKEAALFFETGSYRMMDFIIGVYAPIDIRIERVMTRDQLTALQVSDRISKQMNEEEKMKLCKFVIVNNNEQSVVEQVVNIHQQILNL